MESPRAENNNTGQTNYSPSKAPGLPNDRGREKQDWARRIIFPAGKNDLADTKFVERFCYSDVL
jgi:hypothetical protein